MKPNIGILNALIRITAGFTILTCISSKMVWRPYRESYLLVAIMGAMKIAEGITRFCPLTELFKNYQEQQQEDIAERIRNENTVNPT